MPILIKYMVNVTWSFFLFFHKKIVWITGLRLSIPWAKIYLLCKIISVVSVDLFSYYQLYWRQNSRMFRTGFTVRGSTYTEWHSKLVTHQYLMNKYSIVYPSIWFLINFYYPDLTIDISLVLLKYFYWYIIFWRFTLWVKFHDPSR